VLAGLISTPAWVRIWACVRS